MINDIDIQGHSFGGWPFLLFSRFKESAIQILVAIR